MKTISSVVENYIKSKPFLLNALAQGIINLTSLARIMTDDLELELGKDVKQGAIIMALKRLSEDLSFKVNHKVTKVLRGIGEITVRSSLNDYTFCVSESIFRKQAELIGELNLYPDAFYTFSRGVNETNIVISESLSHLIDKYFQNEKLTQKLENLSSITVRLPKENTVTPGIYYFIFQRLAWEGIVIYEVISTSNEFTVLVDEAVVDKAFKIIKDLKLTK